MGGHTFIVFAFYSFISENPLYLADCVLSMDGNTIIQMYRLWLHGLYEFRRSRSPMYEKGIVSSMSWFSYVTAIHMDHGTGRMGSDVRKHL